MLNSICFNNYSNINEAEHTVVTVGTTSTVVVSAREDRAYLLLYNDGTETIYINLGGDAALNTGIGIPKDSYFELSGANANLYHGAITAICTSGSMKLLVTEGV